MAEDSPSTHIIDQLLAERAPQLLGSPLWPALGPLRDAFFGYRKACRLAEAIAPLSGQKALDHVSELLHLKVRATGVEWVPTTGPCVVVANHPTGIADGIAVYDALKRTRSDICFFANADAQRICPRFDEVLIPIVWPATKRTVRSTKVALRMAREAIEGGQVLVIFAAGLMSKHIDGRLQDPPWESSAVALARKHAVPLVPVSVKGPYSFLFHLFHRISQELRDITLFHEFMNKAGRRYEVTIGAPVDVAALEASNEVLTKRLKHYVERVLPEAPQLAYLEGPSSALEQF
ncbi:MAG: 1-acyl-sn-glycerol-3-phosphate acyltransferase [Pseudomonadota bacterium]